METLDSEYVRLSYVDAEARTDFIKKTYTHVAGSVLAFVVIEYILLSMPWAENLALRLVSSGTTWLLVLGGFMLVTTWAEKMATQSHNRNKQYFGLGLYVLAEAIIFLPIILFAMYKTGDASLLNQASIITLSLFVGLTAIVFTTGKDFSFLKSALMVGGLIGLGLIIAGTLFGFSLGLWFSVGMVVLAAGSILYQTSNMIHKYSTDQYVAAALGLFASLMLLFWYVLRIVMSRD